MPEFRIMILELHGREITVDAEDESKAFEKVHEKLQNTKELPPSMPIQVITPLLWPITQISKIIKVSEINLNQ